MAKKSGSSTPKARSSSTPKARSSSSPKRKASASPVLKVAKANKGKPTEDMTLTAGAMTKESTGLGRLAICFLGINICYMYYGIVQEKLFRPDPRANNQKFDNTLFLFFVQCAMNALFALAGVAAFRSSTGNKSKSLSASSQTSPLNHLLPTKANGWIWLGVISASYLMAMLTSNEALRYVSYPVQALAKSCKMVPVMLGNALVGVKYKPHEYLIVLMITIGITLSQQGPSKSGGKESTLFGMGLLFISLVLDGITGSHQHLFDHEFRLSTHELMLGMNAFALAYTGIALVATGEGFRGYEYVTAHPWIQKDILLFGLASALGQNFIFYTITGPGPLVCTTITTMRKFFTILYSVITYPDNSFTGQQWLGVILVFSGLGTEIAEKAMKQKGKAGKKDKTH